MTEIVLILVIAFLCTLIAWLDYNNRKERKSLINAIKTQHPYDFIQAELADKAKVEMPNEPVSDLIRTEDLSDDEFKQMIDQESKEE